jgi:hypothetical protein
MKHSLSFVTVFLMAFCFWMVGAPIPVYSLEIQTIEINQALGVQKDNHMNFVVGKNTVVRAFLSEAVEVDSATTSAKIYRDSLLFATLSPKSIDKPESIVDFLCPSMEECGNWASGTYQFDVMVNGVSKTEPADGATHSYVFQERRMVKVLAIPVKANYNGTITQVSDDRWKTMHTYTTKVYPIAEDHFIWETREEFDASDDRYNLETDAGQRQLWEDLTGLLPSHCSADPNGVGCYDLIVGFVSDRPNGYPNGVLQGYTYGRPTNIVVAKDEDAPATVAHEVAHVYGVGDTYNGGSLRCDINPAPDGFTGRNWDTPDQETSCFNGRVALGEVSATLIPEAYHPYEVGGRGPLGDMACYMGSGGAQSQFWTSQETYDHLFEQFAPISASASSASIMNTQRLIYFFGYINEAGDVEIEPWETFTDAYATADTQGTYTIAAVDGSGSLLATQKLDINFYILSTPPAPITKIEWAPFEGAMPFPQGTTEFWIMKENEVLGSLPVSANAPVVSNVTPLSATIVSGAYKIQWSGQDPDGDTLYYTIEYNPDVTNAASGWYTLLSDHEQTEWDADFSELPGGDHAMIRITATDGILAASADSAEFTVPVKAPYVTIYELEWGDSYEEGDEVLFEAELFDLQDDTIPDANIKWTSSIDGDIGTGGFIVTEDLSMGEHTITCTATNSSGLTSSDTTTIKVGNISYDFIPFDATAMSDVTLSNTYKNLETDIKISKEAIVKDTFIMFEALSQPDSVDAPTGFDYQGRYFGFYAETTTDPDDEESWSSVESFDAPVSITLDYSKDLPSDIDPASLRVYRFDATSTQWKDVSTDAASGAEVYDRSQTGKLTATLNKLGQYAVIGDKKSASSSSGGGGGCFISAILTPYHVWRSLAAMLFMGVCFSLTINRRKKLSLRKL